MRLLLHKGDTRTYRLEFKDKNNNALDLTNLTVKFIVKDNYSTDDSQAIIDQTATIVDATNGIAEVTLTSTDTNLNYGAYYFEFRLFDSSTQKVTLASGNLIISSAVSDNINNISFVFKENIINLTFQEIIELTSGSGGGGGTSINDTVVSTTTTWSSQKINNELSTKANASHTHSTSDIIDFNSSVDNKISAHNTDNTSHTDIRNAVASKPDIDDTTPSTTTVYSSQKVEDELATKSDITHTHSLNDLTDVNTSGATDGQALTFDSASGLWIPTTISGSGGGSVNGWQFIGEINIATSADATSQIDFTGLDLQQDNAYMIIWYAKWNELGYKDGLLYFNNDFDDNNYYGHFSVNSTAGGSSYSGNQTYFVKFPNAWGKDFFGVIRIYPLSSRVIARFESINTKFSSDQTGYVTYMSGNNISSLHIKTDSTVTNFYRDKSKFQLYKLNK